MNTNRRTLLRLAATSAIGLVASRCPTLARPARPPNFIVVLCDDLGYGDIGPMGGKAIPTPHLDRMAKQGTVLTDYYAPQNICTPSRAGLLTGRYPIRTGLAWGAILQFDQRTLPTSEVTIPKALKSAGYASGLFGKWHLGHTGKDWQPTRHGFDYFFGIPYSHNMQPLVLYTDADPEKPPKSEPPVLSELQQRFYSEAERFIEANASRPFFIELALSAPHLGNYPNANYRDPRMPSPYGEVVEEIDAIVGRLLSKLQTLGIDRDTLVIFTSDNGPWYEGSTGPLRDRKGGAGYDGGYRVPCIARQPGTVPAGRRSDSIAMGIDFLPTFCAMAGVSLPDGVEIDGKDITAVLTHGAPSPHEALLLFDDEEVAAVRTQKWNYVSRTYYHGHLMSLENRYPQLYDMQADPGENYSVAQTHPAAVREMEVRLKEARAVFGPLKKGAPQYGSAAANPPRTD